MDLFQPTQTGSLSSFLARRLFQIAKRAPRCLRYAGPLTIVLVIFCWIVLIAVGFALVYWGSFPAGFEAPESEPRGLLHRCWTVMYFSLASLTTLASAEIFPRQSWIRLASAFESVVGVSLVTASATWIVLIYPALGRMRSLSRRTSSLMRAKQATGIEIFSGDVESLLRDFADSVIRVRVDLIYFPVIYYFHTETEDSSLALSLINLERLSKHAAHDQRPEEVRLSAAFLKVALTDVAATLRTRFLSKPPDMEPKSVFEAMRQDHLETAG